MGGRACFPAVLTEDRELALCLMATLKEDPFPIRLTLPARLCLPVTMHPFPSLPLDPDLSAKTPAPASAVKAPPAEKTQVVSLPAWRPQETAGEDLPWMGDSPQFLHDFLSYKRRGTLGIHALNTALPRSSFCKAALSEGGLGLSLPSTAGLCP